MRGFRARIGGAAARGNKETGGALSPPVATAAKCACVLITPFMSAVYAYEIHILSFAFAERSRRRDGRRVAGEGFAAQPRARK